MTYKANIARLFIPDAMPEDSGVYTCEAVNSVGDAETSTKVLVQGTSRNLELVYKVRVENLELVFKVRVEI